MDDEAGRQGALSRWDGMGVAELGRGCDRLVLLVRCLAKAVIYCIGEIRVRIVWGNLVRNGEMRDLRRTYSVVVTLLMGMFAGVEKDGCVVVDV